jgi:hypothetical protein
MQCVGWRVGYEVGAWKKTRATKINPKTTFCVGMLVCFLETMKSLIYVINIYRILLHYTSHLSVKSFVLFCLLVLNS